MDIPPLAAHSVAEAHLCLMVVPCKLCGEGRTRYVEGQLDSVEDDVRITLHTRCEHCGFDSEFAFKSPAPRTPPEDGGRSISGPAWINPSSSPSAIIDPVQWVTLARVLGEAVDRQSDPPERRRLGCEARQCFEEALKFYGEDDDIPPADTLFHAQSQRQVRIHPDRYLRTRLIALKSKLPALTESERTPAGEADRPEKWWALW
ncbi:MAG: hypothetical protein GY842_19120 [bacterium]|nr:hypothetical protein [bacterium]